MNYKEIISEIKNKNFHPVYFLMGEEPFYIDKITDYISKNILLPEEKEFNQTILYGKDIEVAQIIAEAKQFPFGAEKRVVIIKEAQNIKNIEELEVYTDNLLPSTILVICYKYKKLDKRKKFGKNLSKKALLFESKKLYDNQVPYWIVNYLSEKEFQIEEKAAFMLAEFLGNQLSNISNELDKLILIVKNDKKITAEIVEKNIGISKDYNIFEFQQALGKKDILSSNRIANHFATNPKNHPFVVTLGMLFSYFQKLMTYHSLKDKSKANVASVLKINPFFVQQYSSAARNYSQTKLFNIFSFLKQYDLKSKGVNNSSTKDGDLLKELVYKILH
ncbi:MAG: DNA polymerase III subunit delta [Flavobacteriales bacterium TMED123]|nr:MAG: DNA polymerase III subunit delta [Flavobacteriales bacterium TMED123]